jgi:hypothetical protein
MGAAQDPLTNASLLRRRLQLTLIVSHTVLYVIVLIEASILWPEYRFGFDPAMFWSALLIVSLFSVVAIPFLICNFSFGYVLSYYFYLMIFGFLWVNQFTALDYNHLLAGASAAISGIAFGAPALLINRPVESRPRLSVHATKLILFSAIALCGLIILLGFRTSFHVQDIRTYAQLRDELLITAKLRSSIEFHWLLRYSVGILSSAVLPFAFACFVERRQYWLAALVVFLLAGFFPVTLTKTSLVSPLWLVFVAVIASLFDTRRASVLTLFVPMAIGLLALNTPGNVLGDLFHFLDFRLMVIPSAALSFYNDFFGHHQKTFFCQIGALKALLGCPYQEQLGVVLAKAYGLGNYNASLFATEGVASVGPLLSPIAALLCGLIVGGVNRLSAGLPSRFILVSSAIVIFSFLNVPFSTTLVTHGAALLFLMWYLVPRDFLGIEASRTVTTADQLGSRDSSV